MLPYGRMIANSKGGDVQFHQQTDAAGEMLDRSLIASAHVIVLGVFFLTQRIFAGWSRLPSATVLLLISVALLLRMAELIHFRRRPVSPHARAIAKISIAGTLLLALLLAIASHEPDTPYFGMLMLPILETAVCFSLPATLAVAAVSSLFSVFWVYYAGHFAPPFAVGEMLESATLVLVFFIVGSLVWLLMEHIRQRNRELAGRMMDLEKARHRLIEEEKLAAVGRLASSVAHEIRNPVAIISSALEAAASPSFSRSEREEMSRVAMIEARRLEKLTSDFLSYANLSEEPFAPLNLGTLAGYVEGIVRVQAMDKNLCVNLQADADALCTVEGNEGQLQQVLLNLMRNAVDAAPEGSTVTVRVHPGAAGDAVITIENAGEPIPSSAVNRIFEPFYTSKPNGTGLGLAIARRIVQRHNGSLRLERNDPGRVVFLLTLPAADRAAQIHTGEN